MNLEDLILETQISELTRLETRCREAREVVQNVRAQIAELDVHTADKTEQLQAQNESDMRSQIERLALDVRNRLDQTEVDFAGQRESASESRERRLEELHARLKDEVAECRQKLQSELWVLQSVCDESNEDTPVRNAERAQEIFQTQSNFLDQQLTDLETRVQSTSRYLQQCHAGTDSSLPSMTVELKAREASRVTAVEQVDLALAAAGKLERFHLPQWVIGWRMYGLGLLVFVIVAITATALRADLSKFLNPEFSKPDWEWLGVSCLIGFGAAVLLITVLVMLAQSKLRGAFEDVLQHTVNAKSAADFWKQKSRGELKKMSASAETWKAGMQQRREQHALKLQTATDEKINELIQTYTEQVARQSKLFDDQIMAGETASAQHQSNVESWRSQEVIRIQNHFKGELERARNQITQDTAAKREQLITEENAALSRWRSNLMIAAELKRMSCERTAGLLTWAEMKSAGWTVPSSLPTSLPVGELKATLPNVPESADGALDSEVSIEMPGVLTFPRDTSFSIEHDAAGREAALDFVRATLLRLLTSIAPGRVQFTLIDPVGLGQSFSAMMHLADFDELLVSNRIWTESIQIRDRLQKVTEHMESVFQTYLRSEFETIEDYNAAAGEVAEPYHFVVVAGFPNAFTEEAARALTSILTSGPRCGVHAIVTWSPDQNIPRSFDMANLRNCCTQFHVRNGRVEPGPMPEQRQALKSKPTASDDFLATKQIAGVEQSAEPSVQFSAVMAPDSNDYVSLVRAVGEQSRNARRVEVSFSRIAPKPDAVWSLCSADGVDFPIGRAGAARLQFMRLGRGTSQHVLVAGKTGSGKSTLLHILITNLSMYYSPDEIQFYLIDFKKGVEFRTYAANKLPHARVVAIESDREFGLSVLERLDQVLQERGELFRVRGVQDVPSFRKQFPDEKMPRLLLLIDEFQEFFTAEDRVSSKASLLMDRLIRQGRAFGIHVLLGSQTLGGAYSLARSTLGQVAVRIALQCSESDAHLILSEENSAARQLTRPGEAIYNDANGMVEGNHPFQIAWLDEASRESMIHKLTMRPDYHDRADASMIVFEGNVPPKLEDCKPLNGWLRNQPAADGATHDSVNAWIGDPVSIAAPMSIPFQRSGGQNVLIVGQEGDLADSIFASMILSLCAGGDASGKSVTSEMFFLHDGGDQSSLAKFANTFSPEIVPRLSLLAADAAEMVVEELWNDLNSRESDNGKNRPAVVLAIRNIGQFRSLRKDEDDFGMGSFGAPKTATPASQLSDLIRKGPLVGIHVVVWSDTFGNAMRWLSNSLLREFDSRIAFRLNQTDSSSLIDNPAAASLTQGRAILYRDQTGAADRFRPYQWPAESWMATLPKFEPGEPPAVAEAPVADMVERESTETPAPHLTPAEDLPVETTAVETATEETATEETPTVGASADILDEMTIEAEQTGQTTDVLESNTESVVESPDVISPTESLLVQSLFENPATAELQTTESVESVTLSPEGMSAFSDVDAAMIESELQVQTVFTEYVGAPVTLETEETTSSHDSNSDASEQSESLAAVEKAAAEKAAAEKAAAEKAAAEKAAAEKAAAEKAAAEKAAAEKAAAEKAAAEKAAAEKAAAEKAAAEKAAAEKAAAEKAAAEKAAAEKAAAEKAAAEKAAAEKVAAEKAAAEKVAAAEKLANKATDDGFELSDTLSGQLIPKPSPASDADADDFVLSSDLSGKAVAELSDLSELPPAPALPSVHGRSGTGKPSVMARKMSTRNIDPRRLLDAPPEPKNPNEVRIQGVLPDQPLPVDDFDEMDFNDLMIE